MTRDGDDDDALEALLSRLAATNAPVPTSTLGRLRRGASAGLRAGLGLVGARIRGDRGMAALDPAAIERLVVSLGELKGIAMKVGQMLSYIDGSLPPETRRLLSVLQTRSQPMPAGALEAIVRQDLGAERGGALLERLVREPVATASIGQVHRARLPDAVDVAVKVRHPGIDEAIRSDFRGAQVGRVMARLMAPGVDIGELLSEAQARFLEECDYALEAERQGRFAALYAADERIVVPAVHAAWSGARVLTTTWYDGRGLEALLAGGAPPSPEARSRLGRALYEFYVGTLYSHGLFNADPHPGNLLFPDDGRVVVLDYGCVREFDAGTVRALAALSRAVRGDDAGGMKDALAALGTDDPGREFETSRALLVRFFAPVLAMGVRPIRAGVDLRAQELLRTKRALLRMRLPGKLLFLFRIRFGLYAVLERLGAELDWGRLEAELSERSWITGAGE